MAAEPVGVILAAAGDGRRLGPQGTKALVPLCGRPLLAWALAGVEANQSVEAVVVVTRPDALDAATELSAGSAKVRAVVAGGPTRRASVAAGLAALPPGLEYVAVHDACRPLCPAGAIDGLLDALRGMDGCYGVVPSVPVTDTVRRVAAGDRSGGIVEREDLRALQTPQVFVRAALEAAHRRGGEAPDLVAAATGPEPPPDLVAAAAEATDAVLVERAGFPVAVVAGALDNRAIVTPLDLVAAEALLGRAHGARGAVR